MFAISFTASQATGLKIDLHTGGALVEGLDSNGLARKLETDLDCERHLLRATGIRITPIRVPRVCDPAVESSPEPPLLEVPLEI